MNEWLKEPRVMGIINITPDSFYAKSRAKSIDDALIQAQRLIYHGAEIIDIGAQSTRPGAYQISEAEEWERIFPIVNQLRLAFRDILISVDTYNSETAKGCLQLGVDIINDVSNGCIDSEIQQVAAYFQTTYVLTHSSGNPMDLTRSIQYKNVVQDVYAFFEKELERLLKMGMKNIILDLGFGFAKTKKQNFELLNQLDKFKALGFPVLVGVSRKKMIQTTLDVNAEDSLNGTTVLNTIALMKGANILRVHDAREAQQAITLVRQLSLSSK